MGLCLCASGYSQTKLKSKLIASCCDVGGRCTGSSYCTACANCSGCKHCAQNGGSCGVCSGGNSRSTFTSSSSHRSKSVKKKKKSANYSNSYSSPPYGFYDNSTTTSQTGEEVLYDSVLTVKTSILNVRSGSGTNYSVIVKLEKGDYVRCIETTKEDWVKVEVVPAGTVGYAYKKNLE